MAANIIQPHWLVHALANIHGLTVPAFQALALWGHMQTAGIETTNGLLMVNAGFIQNLPPAVSTGDQVTFIRIMNWAPGKDQQADWTGLTLHTLLQHERDYSRQLMLD